MTFPIAAIETAYAGCRFRSRLEARWACFFDSLGVEWQYEPQGYTFGPDETLYLPDFWLPETRLWVEVKGVLTQPDLETLIWACSAAGLPADGPSNPGRCTPSDVWPWRGRMLLLGDVPDGVESVAHTRIDSVGDVVARQPVLFRVGSSGFTCVPILAPQPLNGFIAGNTVEPGTLAAMTKGVEVPYVNVHNRVVDAYRAGRRARFEHGESGAA